MIYRLVRIGNGDVVHLVTVEHAIDGRVSTLCGYRTVRGWINRGNPGALCLNCQQTLTELNVTMQELWLTNEQSTV